MNQRMEYEKPETESRFSRLKKYYEELQRETERNREEESEHDDL